MPSISFEACDEFDKVSALLRDAGVELDTADLNRINAHLRLVLVLGRAFGLVSDVDLQSRLHQHVIDSLSIVPYVLSWSSSESSVCVDVGTGGGFPGLVCGSVITGIHHVLLERSEKKCAFLRRAVAELDAGGWIEVLCTDFSEFDWSSGPMCVTVRGLEHAEVEVPRLLTLLSPGSRCLWLTGEASSPAFDERFHVEQIVDEWCNSGLRRGVLYQSTIP